VVLRRLCFRDAATVGSVRMTGRMVTVAIALFWVVMNVLLWRAEFGGGRETLAEVPMDTVLDRVLDAPDNSVLVLRHRGRLVGQLRWNPSITEAAPEGDASADVVEGMVRAPLGHAVDVDLNLFGDTPSTRWRVTAHMDLLAHRAWSTFTVQLMQRPASWQVIAKAGDDDIRLRFEEGKTSWEQKFSAKDLADPGAWLAGPYAALLPGGFKAFTSGFAPKKAGAGLDWSAHNDWLRVGQNRVRVYRVRAKLFDKHEAVAYFSRAGEVLKVVLPDGLVLANEALPNLGKE